MQVHAGVPSRISAEASQHVRWLVGGVGLGFLVPFLFADVVGVQRDVYDGIYHGCRVRLLLDVGSSTDQSLREMVSRRWVLAIVLGLVFAGVMSFIVLRQDATSRPSGLTLAAALMWRGVVYGAADGLLLSSFPILAVFAAFTGSPLRSTTIGKIKIGVLALVASIAMTAAYHAGYSDFRSGKIANPIAGDTLWSIPTLVTLNPIAAPIAHIGLHVTAVLHSYSTNLFLPPH